MFYDATPFSRCSDNGAPAGADLQEPGLHALIPEELTLSAYVGNDPVNAADPAGTSCTPAGTQSNGAPAFSCKIDAVATIGKINGQLTVIGVRPVDGRDGRRFDAFNARYTETTNRLASQAHAQPGRTVTVRPFGPNKEGSFTTTPGNMARELIQRTVQYATEGPSGAAMATSGGPGTQQSPFTYVFRSGLNAGPSGIGHEIGLHGSRDEDAGGLQTPENLLGKRFQDAHQRPYQDAACDALGGKRC